MLYRLVVPVASVDLLLDTCTAQLPTNWYYSAVLKNAATWQQHMLNAITLDHNVAIEYSVAS